MICQYKTKTGIQCKNRCIGDLNFCHLKSHHIDLQKYYDMVDKLDKEFESSTITLNDFIVCNVTSDGACAYRTMIKALYDVRKFYDIHMTYESKYFLELIRLMKANDKLYPNLETNLAELIQQLLREWIIDHKDIIIENMNCSLENYIITCHDFDNIKQYDELYKIFAGDDNFIKVPSGKTYKSGKNIGKPIMKKQYIDDRWGASPELYAFSKIFNIHLTVYGLKRFNHKTCQIVSGSLKGLPSRLILLEEFNCPTNNDNNDNSVLQMPKIYFLLTDRQSGHYSYLQYK